MSVLIRGMTMPERCSWCKFIDYFEGNPRGYRCLIDKRPCVLNENNRRRDCPLIEIPPHGDLIDRKALLADTTDMLHSMMVFGGARVYTSDAIKNAPTIIEAEGGDAQ